MKDEADILAPTDEDEPEDLPEAKAIDSAADAALKASRTCEKCGSENLRFNSTTEERRAWCNKCGHNWAVSMATSQLVPSGILDRGLSRRVLVEPDWNTAFEDLTGTEGGIKE